MDSAAAAFWKCSCSEGVRGSPAKPIWVCPSFFRVSRISYIAFSKESQKSVIIFEPSEEMVGYIKHYLPYGAHQEN